MDKPAGPTSHDVVARVRRVRGLRSVGHTGTLDPFATGLLVILLGRATRLARFLTPLEKVYRATACLGVQTDTDDATGQVLAEAHPERWPDDNEVRQAMEELTGRRGQVPPAFSAKLVEGRRSHRLARAGKAVALEPVEVTVYRLECLAWAPPQLEFRATVSAGTYIRAIARDLGERLGVGGHLTALRRERIGHLAVEEAVPLADLGAETPTLPLGRLLEHLPAVMLSDGEVADVRHGRSVQREDTTGLARLEAPDGRLVGVAEAKAIGWHPVVVLEDP